MSATPIPVIRARFFDVNGKPLSGGKLYTYSAGTTTPLATYTDSTANTANTNPVLLDSEGYADVWLSTSNYKFVLKDANDVTIWTKDNVPSLQSLIVAQVNTAGALSRAANLSDLSNVTQALKNLGISPLTYQSDAFAVTANQSAADISGMAFDGDDISSVDMVAEVTQGTTVLAKYFFTLAYKNSTWELITDRTIFNTTAPGVTFSLSQSGSVGQLRAAENGVGNGSITIKYSPFYQPS